MKYSGWALSMIGVICDSEHLPDSFKLQEIKDVLNHASHYQDCFDAGKTPNQCLQLAIEAYQEAH